MNDRPTIAGRPYPRTPADAEWDRLVAEAEKRRLIVVQVSARKYQIGERRYLRNRDVVVPYVVLLPDKFNWFDVRQKFEALAKAGLA